VSGDYYDYIPIDDHTIQVVIAMLPQGVPAALLMSATAARSTGGQGKRNMLEVVDRLTTGSFRI